MPAFQGDEMRQSPGAPERGAPRELFACEITGSPRGMTPTRASMPELFTASLEESGPLPP